MTIEELRTKKVELGKHLFRLRSPSGIEFITQHDDIKHHGNRVDVSRCTVIGEGMNYAEAVAWAEAHKLTQQQIDKLSAELEPRVDVVQGAE